MGGGFVVLDRERQIARVVVPDLTLDLATLAGGSLEADLRQRDFTCNAVAMEIHDGQIWDPLGGAADIAAGVVRMVHPDNLTADPLRVLRGYRHVAQLGFRLEPQTREAMRARGPLLGQVAGERVRTELLGLLAEPGLQALPMADADGVLRCWLPPLGHWDWARRAQSFEPRIPEVEVALADTRPVKWVLTLLIVLWEQRQQLDACLGRLHFSRLERQWCQKIVDHLPRLVELTQQGAISNWDRYSLFAAMGKALPGLIWVARAWPVENWQVWLEQFRDPQHPLAHLVPWLNGQDVMHIAQIPAGPEVGRLLGAVIRAQVDGIIHSRAEAVQWLKNLKRHPGTQDLA
ncbi:MAG: hypothetical protein Q6K08_03400 [Thermostichales cyanobacterium GMQP_bins_62]